MDGTPAGQDVLFVLAHQDDETGAVATIVREESRGHRCWLLYLTDGGRSVSPLVRDAETRSALARIGGEGTQAVFLEDATGRIRDGELVGQLERAQAMAERWLREAGILPARIYTIDWEGGHVDHDAAHLVALSLGRQHRVRIDGFSLYNAYRRPPKFFRVRALIPAAGELTSYPVPWKTAFTASCAPFWYPSQRRTWLALGPGFFVRALADRRERLRAATVPRVQERPHAGKLLYETLFGVPYETFAGASLAYRETLR